ncbi:hypothetical protein ACFQ9X_37920 [Catenulispora yoronensis]
MPHNLQGQLTSFVGRGPEREQAAVLLSRHRLVTLTGLAARARPGWPLSWPLS